MPSSKQRKQEQKRAWTETKAAVHDFAKNPCAATEQAVSAALGKVKNLSATPRKPQKNTKGTTR